MPSRIYLPSTSAAPAITPAQGTGWTATATGFARVLGVTTRSSTALTTQLSTGITATLPSTAVYRQYIVGPMAAQTISGTLTGVIRTVTSNSANQWTMAICVRQVSSTGTHIADLLPIAASVLTSSPPILSAIAATRRFLNAADASSIPLTSRTFSAGDYLVIEIGVRKTNANTTRTVTLTFGDAAATDFAHADDLTTDLNPWVEFNGTLIIVTPPTYRGLTGVTSGIASAAGVISKKTVGVAGIGWSGTQFVASGGTPVLWGADAFQSAGGYPAVTWETDHFEEAE
jgi:hypothetical protein